MTADPYAPYAERRFDVRFGPLVDLRSHVLLGYEAFVSDAPELGSQGSVALRAAAARGGSVAALEYALLAAALTSARDQGLNRKLFCAVHPALFVAEPGAVVRLAALARQCAVDPTSIVLRLDSAALCDCYQAVREPLEQLRGCGFSLALQGVGGGRGDLRVWAELRPDYVEIDGYFSTGLDLDLIKLEFTRSIVDLGRAVGSKVVASGALDAGQCRELAELGVDAAGGPYFGEPSPGLTDPAEAIAILELLRQQESVLTAQQLINEVPTVDPDMQIRDFVRLVYDQAHRDAFPVVDPEGLPLGMIWRNAFLLLYSKPLHPEILAKKPVSAIMDTAPLIIDSRLRLEQVSRLVTRKSRVHLTDQFIITRGGVFAGLGQTIDLLHHITQQQITQAAHSNPLTALPGNMPINDNINRLLAEERQFVVAYVDLDYFKPFNDAYGYARGDQMLLHVAEILRESISPRTDFVGHLGGDDFVMILRSADWVERLRRLVSEFSRSVAAFYSAEHRRAGGIETADRYGELRRFGFLTLSIAILDTSTEQFTSAAQMADRLQVIKCRAKAVPGNCLLYATADGVRELLANTALAAGDGLMVANL